jgi:hypothetical protein
MGDCPSLTPFAHQSIARPNGLCNLLIAPLRMLVGEQDNLCADRQALPGGMSADQAAQMLLFLACQFYLMAWFGSFHGLFLPSRIYPIFWLSSISE